MKANTTIVVQVDSDGNIVTDADQQELLRRYAQQSVELRLVIHDDEAQQIMKVQALEREVVEAMLAAEACVEPNSEFAQRLMAHT